MVLSSRLSALWAMITMLIAVYACEGHAARASASASSENRVIAYIVDWDLPKSIAWNKLDHVIYSFGVPDKSGKLGQFDEGQLKSVVKEAHSNGKTISLAIGGWSGSLYFSSLVNSDSSRQSFAKILSQAVDDYELDGLNIDWEYPNSPNGVACNQNDKADTANFLSFLKTLRQTLKSKKTLITAAVGTAPFNDENQQPSTKLDPEWAAATDGIYIMAYDINGIWNKDTGSSSPLYYDKAKATGVDTATVDSAVKAWVAAGIPAELLVIGVPFYGHISKTKQDVTAQTGMYVPMDTSDQIRGDQYDSKEADPCPNAKASYSGQYEWRSIIEEGIPKNASGWTTYWDQGTMTPYSFKKDASQFLSFDDAESLKAKVQYAKKNKLGGVMMWSLEMDDKDNTLLNALQGMRQ